MKRIAFRTTSTLIYGLIACSILLSGCGGAAPVQPGETAAAQTNTPAAAPRIYDFTACVDPCGSGSNTTTFPANTDSINISWKYENIPQGAHYVRFWTHQQKGLWKTYDCAWDRPSSGQINLRFFDVTGGLAAGVWTVTMKVNDVVIFQKQLTIQGSNNHWVPANPVKACF